MTVSTYLRTILRILEWTLFVFFLFLIGALLSPALTPNSPIGTYVIMSGSMEPTIDTGSLSIVSRTYTSLEIGDIIAFSSPEEPDITIIHRIVDKTPAGLVTRGDNNNASDNWTLSPTEVKGKVVYSIPYLGSAGFKARTPKGFAILVGIPAFLIFLTFMRDIKQGFEEEIDRRSRNLASKQSSGTNSSLESVTSLI